MILLATVSAFTASKSLVILLTLIDVESFNFKATNASNKSL